MTEKTAGKRSTAKPSQPKEKTLEDFSVPSLERGMAMLELIGDCPEGIGVAKISQRLGISLNSAFRISSALEQMKYLRRDPETRRFNLSALMLKLGVKAAHARRNLLECSQDSMQSLRDQSMEMTALGTMLQEDAKGIVLETLNSTHSFGFCLRVGHGFDLHASAPGKVMLAYLSPQEYNKLVNRCKLTRYTATTLTSRAALDAEMEEVRRRGYAVDRGETIGGCNCLGAPILDERGYPAAAIWIAGPSERIRKETFETFGEMVKDAANTISLRLGGR